MEYNPRHRILARRSRQPRQFHIPEPMKRKLRRELLHSIAAKDEVIGSLGRTQVICINRAVRIHNLRKPQLHIRSPRPLHAQPFHARKVLPKVVHIHARLRLRNRLRNQLALHANRRKILRLNRDRLRINCTHTLPTGSGKARQIPIALLQPRILSLAVINLRMKNVTCARLPARVRRHPLHAAVRVLNPQLRPQRRRRVAIIIRLLKPLQRRLIPPRSQQRSDSVLTVFHLRRHIVSLILHMLAIIRPSRREHIVSHSLSVQKHLVSAQSRCI